MANFKTSYEKYIKPIEGGYANVSGDKGGETYAGITRKNYPTWSGWTVVDSKPHPIKNNTKFSELDEAVENFYLGLYNQNNFNKITNQNIADILFDWFVNSGYLAVKTSAAETYGVDEILNTYFGFSLPMDSRFDDATIKAINSVDASKLFDLVKSNRETFYKEIVRKDSTQEKFLTGWLNRIAKFTYTAALISPYLLLIILIIFIWLVH